MINIYKMAAHIPFPSTLGKPETQTLGGQNLKFSRKINIYEMVAILKFLIIADAHIPFRSTLRKPEMQIFH